MQQITELNLFDLDETLIRAPGYTSKKTIELANPELSFNYPYEYYDHPTSLCEDTHNIQLIEPVYDVWKDSSENPNSFSALVTQRVEELESVVKGVLNRREVEMDRYYFLSRKRKKHEILLELMKEFPKASKIRIFDDSVEQLVDYSNAIDQIINSNPEIDVEVWIVDKSKIFRLTSIGVLEFKRITLL